MTKVDLNCDLGESYGIFKLGNDEEVLQYVSSANVACGFHAGDHNVMNHTVQLAKKYGVSIGAHPGFLDLHGFGRREMNVPPNEIFNLVVYQIGALQAVASIHNVSVNHVKPHGALYNLAAKNKEVAEAVAEAVKQVNPNLVLFALPNSQLMKAGKDRGVKVASEVFADRTYQPDGTLTPRTMPNAMIHDSEEAAMQVIKMVTEGKVTAVNGEQVAVEANTICVHGDGPKALQFVMQLKQTLEEHNVIIENNWSGA
ncbi:5-oxoprolinase subunit PxpA [Salirhabdus salicampi]|uniref:5-oxoprolinase subunit PxpA n=1 Tax=Salirhabdus salicampi TaxID=476102 RepID=UPI0020C4C4FD|nr:5-oxoprolinase subunit PxpA [Salirhabdus salicampi]MCP8617838.1 LamB/YcsF family protein [Salirhabdus salicampi]